MIFLLQVLEFHVKIYQALNIIFEIHFDARDTKDREWLDWSLYNDYIMENFANTHEIKYYRSNKHHGYGHYCLVKKNEI